MEFLSPVVYDAIVFGLRLPFLHTTQAIVRYKFINSVVPNLVYKIVNQSRNILITV